MRDVDPEGNVAHIAEHDISIDEVEDVLYNPGNLTGPSNHAGRLLTCGWTETGRLSASPGSVPATIR